MIISILGTAGRDYETKEPKTSYYDCDILEKSNGNFYNATDMLIKNYEDEDFYFIGTEYAIKFQKELLDFTINTKFITVQDDSLDDIFEEVYKLLSEDDDIILDITHGFRHQPISAIFSATLHTFLHDTSLKIIYAKVDELDNQKYQYIYLNQYIQISQLSLMLTGFIHTLNFVHSIKVDGLNTLVFENFSKALLSNNFTELESSYLELLVTLREAKSNKQFAHLKELFEQIEKTLEGFEGFNKEEIYGKYIILANLMSDKNYYLLSITYLFEAIRLYASHSFYDKGIITDTQWSAKEMYFINSDVLYCIEGKGNKFSGVYAKNEQIFRIIFKEYEKLKNLRNNLTHVNHEKIQLNIKGNLEGLLESIGLLIKDDILKKLKK